MSKENPKCSHPGCAEDAIVKVEGDRWLCSRHITERTNSPVNIALTEADAELEKFRDEGGKLS